MSSELIGFLCALGGVILTALTFWLKTVIPNIIKWRQSKEMKELDFGAKLSTDELKLKTELLKKETDRDDKLIEICVDVVKNLPEMIRSIRDGFPSINATVVNSQAILAGSLEGHKAAITNHIDQKLTEHTHLILTEMKDKKIQALVDKVEQNSKSIKHNESIS